MPCRNHPEYIGRIDRCARCRRSFCRDCLVSLDGNSLCAGCKHEHVADLLSGIMPGAIELAPFGRRVLALMIDQTLITIVAYALMVPLTLLTGMLTAVAGGSRAGGVVMGLMIVMIYGIFFSVPIIYEGLMLQFRGQTLGKMALGIKVVTPDGGDIRARQAWTRGLWRLIFGACLAFDYIVALATQERTCIHDLLSSTRVARVRY
ncbi:MAG: RDD family protein [Vicinamibacteria bacterium]|jgi:uncharacterized RDD family membrane protein YckC|nr:RDD family protein [Vicinamibacteria bacterium]